MTLQHPGPAASWGDRWKSNEPTWEASGSAALPGIPRAGKGGRAGGREENKTQKQQLSNNCFLQYVQSIPVQRPWGRGCPAHAQRRRHCGPGPGGYGGAEVALAGGRQAGRGPESPCPRAQGAAAATSCLWAEPKCACSSRSSAHSPGEADGRGEGARGSAPPGARLGAQGEAVGPQIHPETSVLPFPLHMHQVGDPLPSRAPEPRRINTSAGAGSPLTKGLWGSVCVRRGGEDSLPQTAAERPAEQSTPFN